MNLAAAEKEVWRRHRRIMGPAFNTKMYVRSYFVIALYLELLELTCLGTRLGTRLGTCRYNLVWQKTLATYHDWIAAEEWDSKDVIECPRAQQYTFKVRTRTRARCVSSSALC